MKLKFILFLSFTACFCSLGIQAQIKQATIIDELETLEPNTGIIQISCDPKIKELIGNLSVEINEESFIKTSGYRIQVFMSNARTGGNEMNDKRALIRNAFSEIATYPEYLAPNWKLFAGDFLTREEAEIFRQKLQKTIPQLGKEMYVVASDKINIPIQKNN